MYLNLGKSTISGLYNGNRSITKKMLSSILESDGKAYFALLSKLEGRLTKYREIEIVNENNEL